ncbi:variable surface protein [Plasmodium gonderi]|uniref:Variable surface protein n=1 Tax=Plasmodium gonderi TaxID=77519 RepID=A0A1Y1JP50_PLAGO|nr:variable surface protein [Plasmodium gonderi]GAW84366.1 variable surface protein [Plasmodium gonderi]
MISIENLYNMHDSLKKINEEQKSNLENHFYNALKNTLKTYDINIQTQPIEAHNSTIINKCKNNISFHIMITIIALLIISIITYILYKYTPLSSVINLIILMKINMWNKVDEERNIMQRSELFGKISRNNEHNIFYNSPKF